MTRPAAGFTLLEMVMVIIILSVLAAVSAPMLSGTFDSYIVGRQIAEADSQGRLAMERMLRELRFADNAGTAYTLTGSTRVSFKYENGSTNPTVQYYLSGTSLIREESGVQRTLATGVSSLNFTQTVGGASISPGLQITLTVASGDASLTLRSRVYPRN